MSSQELIDTARTLVSGDKGLLASDESNPTCSKRFARWAIPQTEEMRRAHRARCDRAARRGEYDVAMEGHES